MVFRSERLGYTLVIDSVEVNNREAGGPRHLAADTQDGAKNVI